MDHDNRACAFVLQAIQAAAERGAGAVRENWLLPQEVQSFQSGLWQDTHYDACCWGGARYKRQRLRHNIEEIASWPPQRERVASSAAQRGALVPFRGGGGVHSAIGFLRSRSQCLGGLSGSAKPSLLSPVCLCQVVWDAGKRGYPSPAGSPRMGHDAARVVFGPRRTMCFGGGPHTSKENGGVCQAGGWHYPSERRVCGTGQHMHRIPKTKWAAPMVAGHDCPFDEFLPTGTCSTSGTTCSINSLSCLAISSLWTPSPPSRRKATPWQALCLRRFRSKPGTTSGEHAQVSQETCEPFRGSFPKAPGIALAPLVDASQVFPVYLRQEDVFAAVRKLFPEDWLSGLAFPFIEDLVNAPPFDLYTRWLRKAGADWSLPPLLSFGLSVDEHFEQATARLRSPRPTEQAPVLDLVFAASYTAENRTNLRTLRQHAVGAVKELKRRWASVDARLRRHQAPALRRVTAARAARDIGLIALLAVLFAWPDAALPFSMIAGMPAVGFAPCYGVSPQIPVEQVSFEDVMGDWRAHLRTTSPFCSNPPKILNQVSAPLL